jgi:hypothetical protein
MFLLRTNTPNRSEFFLGRPHAKTLFPFLENLKRVNQKDYKSPNKAPVTGREGKQDGIRPLPRPAMSGPRLPPEISDHIVDLLHDEPETLEQCCLVSNSWVPRTRKHLFREVRFESPAGLEAWKTTFPDLTNSPANHTRSLHIYCVRFITDPDTEEGGWFRAFCNVVRLEVWTDGMWNLHLHSVPRLLPQISPRRF